MSDASLELAVLRSLSNIFITGTHG